MTSQAEDRKQQLLAGMCDFARDRLQQDGFATIQPFLAHYYAQVGADGVLGTNVEDLYGAALAHWQLARGFVSGAPRVHVYNPELEEHGWKSAHTVIEIVNDDMPFLVDSVTMEINRLGLTLHSAIHPVFRVWRDAQGRIEKLQPASDNLPEGSTHATLESWMHFEVDRCSEPEKLEALRTGIAKALSDVRAAVTDWPAMLDAARRSIKELADDHQGDAARQAEVTEARAFLEWLTAGHFIFLGYRDFDLITKDGDNFLQGKADTGLGILRSSARAQEGDAARLSAGARRIIEATSPLFLTKADSRATVHRPGHLDYVGVKRYGADGRVIGEHRFLGLYTSPAYSGSTSDIPMVCKKVANVIGRTSFVHGGHLAKAFAAILDQFPRDELFQIEEDDLFDTAMGILRLEERQRTRLFVRRDVLDRYVSCIIFVPREKYTTELRVQIQKLLLKSFNGSSVEFTPLLSESVLARLYITVHARPEGLPNVNIGELEEQIVQATRGWDDELRESLLERFGEEKGSLLLRRYAGAFPAAFRADYSARATVRDIELMESLNGSEGNGDPTMSLYRPIEAPAPSVRLKIYHAATPIALSKSLPMLEHMGVKVHNERPYRIDRNEAQPVWMHDFDMETADGSEIDIGLVKKVFETAVARVWSGEAENDDLNRLVLLARMDWREVVILRAYARYLRQVGSTFSNAYVEQALNGNPTIARRLVELFLARFALASSGDRAERMSALQQEIEEDLQQVPSLDEDRILRQFLGMIDATLRTNYFQHASGDAPKPYLSFKFDPAMVPGLPEPKPMFEIWVYSPRVEGVHLRGGKVARGGLRWSDRREDFRTEVLGLVKAQMVKNAVIVPVGSKGCFIVKNPPPASDRDAWMREGIACYQTFLRGLLDLTDNLAGGAVVPPADVIRHDGDDPYLVVAADKGTATFSDYANAISAEYGFWLGDAFASGGSVGYDHKKMGITARGAWESVKRHFSKLGVNTQQEDFTVAGIGDMSGDVFGNGMLLSRHIKLLAAFDHRHIFLDPDPDPAVSFAERERLFRLPRSSWADYESELISPGGGVYPRSLKAIPISPEVGAALGISAAELSPAELIRAILLAPVDLLYNGGIGTYIKATRETHAQVGDKANDAIRVNGAELRCKVVAEGGNLGVTQLGRIEFAQSSTGGGSINTDAIDNSAGVDCSDHEVNIKILLNLVVADGEMTEKQRNVLLADMTDDVGRMVLSDNYYQTQALALARHVAADMLEPEARLMRFLEQAGRLNRAIEFLPADDEIAERKLAKQGLFSPEHAVLLAYSKMWTSHEMLNSDLPEEPVIARALAQYFPEQLRERYRTTMEQHPLKREIIATYQTNVLVNRVGPTFVHRLSEESGRSAADIMRAGVIAREAFGLDDIWAGIDALDNRISADLQTDMFIAIGRLMEYATLWFLRHHDARESMEATAARLRVAADDLGPKLVTLLAARDAEILAAKRDALMDAGVPQELARRIASAEIVGAVLDIAEVASATRRNLELVASIYFSLDVYLNYNAIRERVAALPADTHWQMLARTALHNDLTSLQRTLTTDLLNLSPALDAPAQLIAAWQAYNQATLQRYHGVLADLQSASMVDLAMLSVLVKEMRAIQTIRYAGQANEKAVAANDSGG
ncbi:NAD-glutamate dehydrogenase [Noviherbaspirillum cavernae]|uniref:NAD-glutamate dehydrogenase n=1 Tax=Noviherbaspirillum cavernae TaxID=2320862 RepID=A0A418WVF3_9BURK|nr:NAD-glutamate dehydrogenase [Noviherbaspirillum cavernae]RJF96647.1 NAD-glutamate dehydrogenase [Noviherbaspirillum cavernae]